MRHVLPVLRAGSIYFNTYRHSGAIILKAIYGYGVQKRNDPHIFEAEDANVKMLRVLQESPYLVDIFPFRKFHPRIPPVPFFVYNYLFVTVRYIPRWLPGGGFQRVASETKFAAFKMRDVMFEYAKQNMVGEAALHFLVQHSDLT